jgi:hypothetical protein
LRGRGPHNAITAVIKRILQPAISAKQAGNEHRLTAEAARWADFAAMRVRHEWQRLSIAAILLLLIAGSTCYRCARPRVHNGGSRSRTARTFLINHLSHEEIVAATAARFALSRPGQQACRPDLDPPPQPDVNYPHASTAVSQDVWPVAEEDVPETSRRVSAGRAPPAA